MSGTTDPLSTLVSGVSFTTLETDVVTLAVTVAAFYVILVGIKWVLHQVRRV